MDLPQNSGTMAKARYSETWHKHKATHVCRTPASPLLFVVLLTNPWKIVMARLNRSEVFDPNEVSVMHCNRTLCGCEIQ